MNNKLLILSSRLISEEMQNSFGKIPSAMLPIVSGCNSIDKIFQDFSSDYSQIFISVYEEKELLLDYIEHKYKKKIIPIILDKLEDIGYTVKYCYNQISQKILEPIDNFTIIFGDTNLKEKINVLNSICDIYLYSKTEDKTRWTVFDIVNNELIISDKQKDRIENENEYNTFIGLFNFKNVKKLIEKIPSEVNEIEDTFYFALSEIYDDKNIKLLETLSWEDFGHLDNYYSSKKEVATRYFNSLEIDRERGILTKKSKEIKKFLNEIKWYLEIPKKIQYIAPRIFDYSLEGNDSYISMEYYGYPTLHELFLFGNYGINKWNKIFDVLFFVNEDLKRYKLELKNEEIKDALREIYFIKTLERLEELKKSEKFEKYFYEKIIINEVLYPSLDELIYNLEKTIEDFGIYQVESFNIIHGDYFFANILYDTNSNLIRLVDPRGDFGGYGIYGDNRYELAKLSHSIDGKYDFIVEDMFNLNYEENNINYKISHDARHDLIKNIFYKKLEKLESTTTIKFIQSLLFLSMIPLHKDKPERQIVMLATGIELYYKSIEEKKEKK
ncbi:MAG: hypothetical protein ACRC5T_06140 [Cetobacterium sp.]